MSARKADSAIEKAINDMIDESRKIFEKNVVPTIKDVTSGAKTGLKDLVKKLDQLEKKVDNLSKKSTTESKPAAKKTAAKKPAAKKTAAKKPAAKKAAAKTSGK